jgi:organic radical activating enzyme
MAQMSAGGLTAALAGVPAGLQAQGVWAGRRQMFVRFAAEAETATLYTADALANEIRRTTGRSTFHSISISGRDPLANVEYLCAALDRAPKTLPAMLDCDGQRPESISDVRSIVALVQVTLEGQTLAAHAERAAESIRAAREAQVRHALVLCVDERTSEALVLRTLEQAHVASDSVSVVIHPGAGTPVDRDRRWINLLERGAAVHPDVRVALRLPPPTGMR